MNFLELYIKAHGPKNQPPSSPSTMYFQKMQFLGVFCSFFQRSLIYYRICIFNDFYLILIFRGSRIGSCLYDCNCTWLHFTFSRWILWQRRNCHFLHAFYLLFMDQKCQNRTNLLGSPMVRNWFFMYTFQFRT